MKRLFCLLLSLCIIAAPVSIPVFADDTTDPSIIMFDDLANSSKTSSFNNLIFETRGFVLSDAAFPNNQDLNNPYTTGIARRDGSNSNKVASLTYVLPSVNIATTQIIFDTFYYYSGGYAGAASDATKLDYLNASLNYLKLKIYQSPDGVNFTECQNVTLDKYPAPWKGQSSHYVKYTAKNLSSDTKYYKIEIPSIESVSGVTVYGWDPAINSVTVKDTSAASTVKVVDDMTNANLMAEKSSNLIFENRNIVLAYYPENLDLNNPYHATITRRDGADYNKEAHITYNLNTVGVPAESTDVQILAHFSYFYGSAGVTQDDTNLDALNKSLQYYGLKIYESPDNVSFTECTNVSISKVPSPWPGQSMHTAVYNITNLSADTNYVKIVIPSLENVTGVSVAGWDPYLDKVTFTNRAVGSTVEKLDPLNNSSMLVSYSPNMSFQQHNVCSATYNNINAPYTSYFAHRDGTNQKDEGYLVYGIDESPATTKMTVDSYYYYSFNYGGPATPTDTSLDYLNRSLATLQLKFYESADNITFTPVSDVTLTKLPGPWGGQSDHEVIYNVKGFSADTKYVKIVFPAVDGVTFYGWDPMVDSVKIDTTIGGTTEPVKQALALSNVYMNDMVLQANEPVTVAGLVEKGTTVTATLSDGTNSYTATAVSDDSNNFSMKFDRTFEPGYTPYTLTVTDGTAVRTFSNLLFGDVYMLAGQSNMEFDMNFCYNTEQGDAKTGVQNDINNANNQYLKFLKTANSSAPVPTTETAIATRWTSVSSSNVGALSAIGYYFGQALQKQVNYPIGLLDVAWGGTSISSWVKNGSIYNNHIYPFKDFNIKGCLWYQGESDDFSASTYKTRQVKFIDNLREFFGQDMPFCMVQLANYGSDGPQTFHIVREQQLDTFKQYEFNAQALDTQNKVGIISIIDQFVSNPGNIHPEGKKELASRLLIWANSIIYGNGSEYSGPIVQQAVKIGNDYQITFDHVGNGLISTNGGSISGLQVVDNAGTAYDVTGTIVGKNKIVFTSTQPNIVNVQYAYKEYNTGANISNQSGLSAPAFGPVTIANSAIVDVSMKNAAGQDTYDIIPGGKITAARVVSPEIASGSLLICVYENGILKATKVAEITSLNYVNDVATANIDLNIPSTINSSNAKIKVFFVNSLGIIQPIVNSITQK